MNQSKFEPEVDILPSPAEAARIINEKTIPVSLRINEKTQAFFDSQALTYGISGNVMMSLLLDRYVDYQDNVVVKSDGLNLIILQKHLERCAKIVKKADDITLLQNILNEGDSLAAMNAMPDEISLILQNYAAVCKGKMSCVDANLQIWTNDANFHCLGKTDLSAFIDTQFAEENHCYFYDLFIPPQKWPVVVYIAKNYEFKVQQLFPGENELKTYQRAAVGKKFYLELIEIINSTNDRAELAQRIASAYLAAQGIEDVVTDKEPRKDPKPVGYSDLYFGTKRYGGGATVYDNVSFVVRALEQLRGVQHFNRIVDRAQSLRLLKYPDGKIPEKFDSVISNVLQTHSSDLRSYNGKDDFFTHPAPGYWGLRPGVHTDADGKVVTD